MNTPTPSIITKAHFVSNHDGDTVTVEVVRRFSVRLKDIDTPEIKEFQGVEAKEFVTKELSSAKEIIVVIPTNDEVSLLDFNSFNRIVGEIYYDGKNLRDELKKAGFVKKERS